jgi:hypothetical protein
MNARLLYIVLSHALHTVLTALILIMCCVQQIFRKYCPGFVQPVRHLTSSRTAASTTSTPSPLLRRAAASTTVVAAVAVGQDSSYDAVEQLRLMGPPAARALLRDCGLYSDIGTGRLGVLSRSQLDKVTVVMYELYTNLRYLYSIDVCVSILLCSVT